MPNYQVVSKTHHTTKRWQRFASYQFAASDAVASLVVKELPSAVMHLPIGFIAADQTFSLVAMQGLAPGKNLLVAPDGRWLAGYVPAAYRSFPFALANTENGQQVLCIDEESGLLSDAEGELFFNDDGTPSKSVADVLNFLEHVQANREATVRICAVLQKHDLIQPWPIKVKTESGERNIEGLHRIDEAALNALPEEAFAELRKTGALPVAYCQLLSMQHLAKLGKLAQAHAQAQTAPAAAPNGELDLEFLKNDGNISFGNIH
ncbi:SapC family protein [Nitrosomonas sp. ANs5]|uniref:SapC family protein n=1 Tax=Nitrosomonas sp. ANs5 TaxID=3423941 RepID=UPI003D353895